MAPVEVNIEFLDNRSMGWSHAREAGFTLLYQAWLWPFYLAPVVVHQDSGIIPRMIPKDAKLVQLHLFYKNGLPEGFGVGLDESFFTDHPEMEALLVKCSQMSIDEYKKQKTDRQRRTFVAGIVSQFNTACQWMHEHKAEPGIDDEFMSMFVILLDDMSFLQSVGLFPNNNFNGPMWTWKDNEVKVNEHIRLHQRSNT